MVVSSRKSARGLVRATGILLACATSALAGLGLVFKLVTPATVAQLGTPHLLGLIGLLVLPVLVLVLQRRTAEEAEAALSSTTSVAVVEGDEQRQRHDVVVLAPDLRDRTARRHRHRSAATTPARATVGR